MDDNNQTTTVTNGTVINADLSKEMKTSFMDYAMSVIVARALPDVRDGLKPVHRRILYDMWELGIKSSGEFKKSARVVGDVLGKYHPHGDASVYDALVRLAQNFSQRYIVVKPHGNFGSIDGDPPAAMRYTEAKMAVLGEEMLVDIQKETVNMIDNYDGSLQEPEVLPASFPFLLANGSSGIAVGMATNMPPHNLTEICNAAISMIDNPEIDSEGLMNYIKGPDFPTSAVICGTKGIKEAYLTGRGKVVMRAVYEIEELKNHTQIVFTQIPYQVNKARLHERILELRREEIIKGIGEVRDETSEKGGIRLVVELKKGAVASVVVNCLFKHTDLQCNFNVINLALVDGRPKILTLRDLIYYYLKHREDVVTRRTQFDLRKAQERAHILRGLKIALDNIDRVIQIIKQSKDNSVAIQSLMKEFGLDEIQGKAIIDMKLGRLSNLETQQILDELAELENKIAFYEKVLSSKDELLKVIKGEIEEMRDKYGDERKTVISPIELGNSNIEDFIKKEDVVVTATAKGFIKRVPLLEYKAQGRGGKGTKGVTLRGEDRTVAIYSCNTHDYLMFFTNHGKAFYCKVYEIEDASKTGKGSSIKSILQLEENEDITSVITFKEFEKGKSIFMLTRMGIAKRIDMFSLRNARSRGLIAMNLDENDELKFVQFVADNDEVLVVTKFAKALKYPVNEVRQMGRAARGVKGIGLKKEGDEVVGLARAGENDRCIIVNNKGKGKQVDFSLFNTHGRSTGGQKIFTLAEGESIITALNASNEEDLICLTQAGQTIRIHIDAISDQGRAAKGVILFKLKKASDEIVSVAKVPRSQDEDIAEAEGEENEGLQSDSSSQDTE